MNLKEMLGDSLPVISKFAPTIGAAVGGPYGIAAGYAVSVLSNAFSHNPSDIKGLAEKILTDENVQQTLETVETVHGDLLKTFGNSVNRLSKADVHITLEWQN